MDLAAAANSVAPQRQVTVKSAPRLIVCVALVALLSAVSVGAARAAGTLSPTKASSDEFSAGASGGLTQLSYDPFTNPTSQHRTQVEPDSYSNGRQTVAVFQSGRFFSGGASDIGWATSAASDGTGWSHGFLPGTTTFAGGPYAAISDPGVTYDVAHHEWLITSLALDAQTHGAAILVSRSRNGLDWSQPVSVSTADATKGQDFDKPWIVCDNTPSSPFFGHCYVEYDDFGHADMVKMSTSTDGGETWGASLDAAAGSLGFGGQPVVQPNGTVNVPTLDLAFRSIFSFRSTDGGASWGPGVTVSPVSYHPAAGSLRNAPLPSATVDATGNVYVVWQDCSFRPACASNDIVLSTSGDGVNWSPVSRVPIDAADSGADHFIPGLAVAPHTSGAPARLALAYYYYPSADCTAATCQLYVGFIHSPDGGEHWGEPAQLAGPMSLGWLPNTSQGLMVGDYISTSFLAGVPKPFFALAKPPSNSRFHEAIYTTAGPRDEREGVLRPVQHERATLPQREGGGGPRGLVR